MGDLAELLPNSDQVRRPALPIVHYLRGSQMKKLVIALLATVVAFSVSGCVGIGKGKARPAVVTKG